MKKFLKIAFLTSLLGSLAVAVGGYIAIKHLQSGLPPLTALKEYRPGLTTRIVARDATLMAELSHEHRYLVEPSDLPRHVLQSFIAAEDSSFYEHSGIDYLGILRAAWANAKSGRVVQGGSTITQQVAKSLLLTPERSLKRKAREALLAIRIEKNLSKQEILRLYLNQIYLGHGAYGIEAAARTYFGVSAERLTISQAALLAGMPKAPSTYDPYRNPEAALRRRSYVLSQLEKNGEITALEAEAARKAPLVLSHNEEAYTTVSPYFSEYIRREIEERYGSDALLKEGLTVTATMDPRLQRAAREALREGIRAHDRRQGYRGALRKHEGEDLAPFTSGAVPRAGDNGEALVLSVGAKAIEVLSRGCVFTIDATTMEWALGEQKPGELFTPGDVVLVRYLAGLERGLYAELDQEPEAEGALVCIDPWTGEVLAAVGGYSASRSQFNRATQAARQPGSSIKPLIYAAAIEDGLTPAHLVYDSPIVYESADLDEKWKPKNYSEKFYGATTLRDALIKSRNVVTIKLLQDMGIPRAIAFLRDAGVKSHINEDLSLALGASVMPPIEIASAYSVFATAGKRQEPFFLTSVTSRDGEVLEQTEPAEPEHPSIDPRVAFVMNDMMQAVITQGTGKRARGLPVPAAGKTGTTNDTRDAWFVGFTPDLVAAVWVGRDDNESLGRYETGGRVAAPIWKAFMEVAVEGRARTDFPTVEGIEFARVDAEKGTLAGPDSARTFQAAFIAGTTPEPSERLQVEIAPEEGGEERPVSFDLDDPGALDMLR